MSFPYTPKDKGSGGNKSGYSPESATSDSTASSTQVGSVGNLPVGELQEDEIEALQEGLPEAISEKIYMSTEETCAEEQLVEDLQEHGLLDNHKFIGLDNKGRAYFLEIATRFHEEAVDEIDSQILSQSVDSDGDDDSLQLLTHCAYPINIGRFRKYPDLAIYGSERIVEGRGKARVKMSKVERFDLPNPMNPNVIIEFSWSNKLDQEISKLNLQMTDHEPSLGLVNVGYLIKAIPANAVQEPQASYGPSPKGIGWRYAAPAEVPRQIQEVLVEPWLRDALIRLNPEVAAQPDRAEEVLYKLRAIVLSVRSDGLIRANEEMTAWMRGERTMPFGPNNEHVPVRLIDFDTLDNNRFVITNQYAVKALETKIPDIVLLINGIPIVVGEAKTPVRPSVSWLDGAHEIHNIYENSIPQLFVPNLLSFATEGKELYYGSVRCPLEFWSPWRVESDADDLLQKLGLNEVGKQLSDLLRPERLLDLLQNFCLYTSDKKKRRIKIICRYQQYEGANNARRPAECLSLWPHRHTDQ